MKTQKIFDLTVLSLILLAITVYYTVDGFQRGGMHAGIMFGFAVLGGIATLYCTVCLIRSR